MKSGATTKPSRDLEAQEPERQWIELDETLHQKARLAIVSALLSGGESDFKTLKANLELTDGNLSSHLSTLEAKGYVAIKKEFLGKRPHTIISLTQEGSTAFATYLEVLESILAQMKGSKQ